MFLSIKLRKTGFALCAMVLAFCIAAAILSPSAAADSKDGVKVPIIMYHSIVEDEARWNDYVLSPNELEKDIIWLKKHGYETVFVSELSDYVRYGGELPEKPVVLSFDDGTYNNLVYVLPLLEKYNVKATISIVGSYSEFACEEAEPSPLYSYLDWKDISKLQKSGLVEIANHTYDMHSCDLRQGVKMLDGESFEDYRRAFLNDTFKTQRLLSENCGIEPKVFTYPYGYTCDAAKQLVRECGFDASLGVGSGINTLISGDKDCLYNLSRTNRPSFVLTDDFMTKTMGLE